MPPSRDSNPDCQRLEALDALRSEGRIPDAADAAFAAQHVASCATCRSHAAVIELLAREPPGGCGPAPPLPPSERLELIEAILDAADAPVPSARTVDRRPWGWVALAAAAGLLVIAGAVAHPAFRGSPMKASSWPLESTTELHGLLVDGTDTRIDQAAAAPGTWLRTGQVLEAGSGEVRLRIPPRAEVTLAPGSWLRLDRLGPEGSRITLERGALQASLPAGAVPRSGFLVHTRAGTVEVTGTRFSVQVEEETTRVTVLRGQVRITGVDGAHRRVDPGQVGLLAPGRIEVRAASLEDRGWPPGAPTGEIRQARPEGAEPIRRDSPRPRSADPSGPRVNEQPVPPAGAASSWEHRLAEATDHLSRRDFRAAAAAYRRLLRDHGEVAAAQTVRVALSRLLLASLGEPAGALALCEDYLARAPRGPLAEEAEFCRIQALARLGRREEAGRAGLRFLRDHGRSFHVPVVRQLVESRAPREGPVRP